LQIEQNIYEFLQKWHPTVEGINVVQGVLGGGLALVVVLGVGYVAYVLGRRYSERTTSSPFQRLPRQEEI
jgi:hypothetical protein